MEEQSSNSDVIGFPEMTTSIFCTVKSDCSSYHSNLALLVARNPFSAKCVIRGKNLQGTTIPLPHLSAAWKHFGEMIDTMHLSHEDGIDITLPDVETEILSTAINLICYGAVKEVKVKRDDVITFFEDFGFDVNVIREIVPSVTDSRGDDDALSSVDQVFYNAVEDVAFDDSDSGAEKLFAYYHKSEDFCSKHCGGNCYKQYKAWSEDLQTRFETMFKCEKIIDSKTKLLNHLKTQFDVNGMPTSSFVINGHEFCIGFLSLKTGISQHILKGVLNDFHNGRSLYEHGNRGILKNRTLPSIKAISWLKCYSEVYGQASPEEDVIVLSHWLKKKHLYQMYVSETSAPHVSKSTFYHIFNHDFGVNRPDKTLPRLRISKYSTHSVCTICVILNMKLKEAKTEDELKIVKAAVNEHRLKFGDARRKVGEIRQSAISFPSDNLFIQIDAMDNTKSYLPRYKVSSKDQVGKERLVSKISGCIISNGFYEHQRKVLFFINHDIFENGSNLVITLIHLCLLRFVSEFKMLPKKLHLNLDNCWKAGYFKNLCTKY